MRKNMKIPREKYKPEQPVIVSRITRLPTLYELTKKKSRIGTKSCDEEQCMEDL
jgi:hypothetical protein